MNTRVNPGAQQGGPADLDETDEGGLTAYRVGAVTSQSAIDKFKNTRGTVLGSNYVDEQTDWDGLTKEQEVQLEHADAERELDEELDENEELYQETIAEFDRQEEVISNKMKDMEAETYHKNGKAVFMDEFGRPIYADGTLLDGQDKQDALDAKAKGQRFDDYNLYHQLDDQWNKLDQGKQSLINRHTNNQNEINANLASGNISGAKAAADRDQQDIMSAKAAAQDVHTEMSSLQVNHDAIAAQITATDTDISSMMGRHPSASQTDTQSAVSSTTRNTTVAAQQFGTVSDLSSKGPFTAASAPVSIASVTPDVTDENAGASQRAPVTPSPPASV